MVSLRKLFMIVAGLVLVASVASAVPVTLTCAVPAVSTNVFRAEGRTEALNTIDYTCTPGAAELATDFTLQLFLGGGVSVTSQDASVASGTQYAVATVNGVAKNGAVSGNSVTWSGVSFPAGAGAFHIVFSGILVDASMIPTGSTIGVNVLAASSDSTQIPSSIFATSGANSPISQLANVAIALKSLTVSDDTSTTNFGDVDSSKKFIKIPKCSTKDGFDPTKSQVVNAGFVLDTVKFVGVLNTSFAGTQRVTYTISNVPTGVTLYAPNQVTSGAGPTLQTADLLLGYKADLSGGYLASVISSDIYTKVPASGTVVYQITTAPTTAGISFDFPIYAQVDNPTAAAAPTAITAGYAPVGTSAIPRFVDGTSADADVLHLINCTTTLFFPYVVVGGGYDTGLAVANAGSDVTDPTTALDGTCTFTFNGAGAPTATHDLAVKAGQTNAFDLLTAYPTGSFSGYAVATCDFQLGTGYAFVVNSQGSSASYLPMIK